MVSNTLPWPKGALCIVSAACHDRTLFMISDALASRLETNTPAFSGTVAEWQRGRPVGRHVRAVAQAPLARQNTA